MEPLTWNIPIRRRFFVSLLAGTLVTAGCTPVRLLLNGTGLHRNHFYVLRDFMETIIPEAKMTEKEAGYFFDPSYPFFPYTEIFISDLNHSTVRLYGKSTFSELNPSEREKLIENRLGKPMVDKLYYTAIWMTQVIYYTGISRSDLSCPIIGFKPEAPHEKNEITYPDPGDFIGRCETKNGNLN